MKVLMISTDEKIFDKNSAVRQRMIEYAGLVDELHVLIKTNKYKEKENQGNLFLYPVSYKTKLGYKNRAEKIGKSIKRPDLITSQDPFENGYVGWRLSKYFNCKLQLQIHTDFLSPYFGKESLLNKIRVKVAKFLIPRADCIRVVSRKIKDSVVSEIEIDPNKIVVLPIFVDTEKIKNSPIKTDLHQKYSQFDFIILMASRLTKEKNIGLAVEAMKGVIEKYPEVGLVIVGKGDKKEDLESKVKKYDLDKNILFEDWTEDLVSYYKTCDLFLLTSNYEGYGLTLVEAVAAGCKVISTGVGVAREILEDESVLNINDKNVLEEKVAKAINKGLSLPKKIFLGGLPNKTEYFMMYKRHWRSCLG